MSEAGLVENQSMSKIDLLMILGEMLKDELGINNLKLELKLKDSNVNLIKDVVDSFPECLNKISSSMEFVLQDDKLDVSDVPILVKLVKDIVNGSSKGVEKLKNVTVEQWVDFIRNILEILIHKDIIKVDNKEKVFKLLFVSSELLSTTIEVSGGINSIFKCFKC